MADNDNIQNRLTALRGDITERKKNSSDKASPRLPHDGSEPENHDVKLREMLNKIRSHLRETKEESELSD